MQIDFIRRDVPESFSEEGGAYIQLVNKNTVGLKSSIDEAKSALYVVGAPSMIEGYFTGIMRSAFEGIREDGHPRTVGDITFFPVCGGTFDLDKGWDPAVNDVRIKARLLNGITLDVSDWTFRDMTEGRQSYSIETVSNGTATGVVSRNANAELNGKNFPDKAKLSVSWTCGLKGGVVSASQFTANVARITIDKAAFSALTADDDGKEIVFTVKGCYNKATKAATYKYVPLAESEDGRVKIDTVAPGEGTEFEIGKSIKETGVNLGYDGTAETGIMGAFLEFPGEKIHNLGTPTATEGETVLTLPPGTEPLKGVEVGEYDVNLVHEYVKEGTSAGRVTVPIRVKVTEYIPEE